MEYTGYFHGNRTCRDRQTYKQDKVFNMLQMLSFRISPVLTASVLRENTHYIWPHCVKGSHFGSNGAANRGGHNQSHCNQLSSGMSRCRWLASTFLTGSVISAEGLVRLRLSAISCVWIWVWMYSKCDVGGTVVSTVSTQCQGLLRCFGLCMLPNASSLTSHPV